MHALLAGIRVHHQAAGIALLRLDVGNHSRTQVLAVAVVDRPRVAQVSEDVARSAAHFCAVEGDLAGAGAGVPLQLHGARLVDQDQRLVLGQHILVEGVGDVDGHKVIQLLQRRLARLVAALADCLGRQVVLQRERQ